MTDKSNKELEKATTDKINTLTKERTNVANEVFTLHFLMATIFFLDIYFLCEVIRLDSVTVMSFLFLFASLLCFIIPIFFILPYEREKIRRKKVLTKTIENITLQTITIVINNSNRNKK